VLLLQHPREQRVAVGTARMAHLALPNSDLRVGTNFVADPIVATAIANPQPAYVLFPGRDATDVSELPRDRPLTLLVLDGTWSQARKLLTLNPHLAALPRVAFSPRRPSDYRIRRQPAAHCVSTIEALAEVLDAIEPEGADGRARASGRFDRLLDPFRAMVDRQQRYASDLHAHRHLMARRSPRVSGDVLLARRLLAVWPHVVCVQGEANAWPTRDQDRPPPEIVHWVAHRPASGETYEAVVAPRRPLGPSTPAHIQVSSERIMRGGSLSDWFSSWAAFVRSDDVVIHWGSFYRDLAASEGLPGPMGRLDMRAEVSQAFRKRLGAVEDCAAALEALRSRPERDFDHGSRALCATLALSGRAGRRLSALVSVVVTMVGPPQCR
jgi:DTW domain-containing protein YfiP